MNSRATLPTKMWPALAHYSNALVGGLIVAAGLALLLALWFGWIDILPHTSEVGGAAARDEPSAIPNTIELPQEKFAAAELHTTKVRKQLVRPMREVPGEIGYDEPRRVPVNAPVGGVVLEVLVDPAKEVDKGQPLAMLSCPDIGVARDAVEKRRSDLALAQREERRATEIATHVDELLELLAMRPKLTEVEAAVERRTLGEYREKIIGAYSRLLFAERVSEASSTLEGGSVSNRVIEQRKAEREQEAAKFRSACETARFAALQERERNKAAAEQTQRLLAVAEQALKNLLGPWAEMDRVVDAERLNELKLLSPVSGRVVERQAVQSARVEAGSPLFVVADTSQMWVSAEIHERDWRALEHVTQGDDLEVRVPALGTELLRAKIRWVGPHVEAVKRSAALVAEISNTECRLKPGMFVWAIIPLDQPHEALVVPSGAIMRHENQPFVFVPDGERTFRRVEVEVGLETNETIEITAGLSAGDTVVDRGAFFLKSELLLEREE